MYATPSQNEMTRAMLGRDASYDGVFFTAVKTTGIFCRPSCPGKKPHAKNVEYFPTAREALLAGYRPCKRCRPMDTNGRPPEWVERLLAEVERKPTRRWRDRDLRAMAIDPARARRYFNEHYGMTFQAYSRSRRMGVALAQIREGGPLMKVAMEHGYQSNSGFRDAFEKVFGQPPGKSQMVDHIVATIIESPIGSLLLGATDKALCLLEFSDRRALETQVATLRRRFDNSIVPGTNKWTEQAVDELTQYFEGKLKRFRVPIVYPGTPFQQTVWDRLRQIPYGETISYARLAKDVGQPNAQRAVGTANGKNRLAIIIPCHRVVNKDGKLGGYGGGLWRKQFLLDLERGMGKNGLF